MKSKWRAIRHAVAIASVVSGIACIIVSVVGLCLSDQYWTLVAVGSMVASWVVVGATVASWHFVTTFISEYKACREGDEPNHPNVRCVTLPFGDDPPPMPRGEAQRCPHCNREYRYNPEYDAGRRPDRGSTDDPAQWIVSMGICPACYDRAHCGTSDMFERRQQKFEVVKHEGNAR